MPSSPPPKAPGSTPDQPRGPRTDVPRAGVTPVAARSWLAVSRGAPGPPPSPCRVDRGLDPRLVLGFADLGVDGLGEPDRRGAAQKSHGGPYPRPVAPHVTLRSTCSASVPSRRPARPRQSHPRQLVDGGVIGGIDVSLTDSSDSAVGCGCAPTPSADDFRQPPRSSSSGPIAGAMTNRGAPMSLARIHNLSISLDGFATGEPQSADAPFGHAGERLHEWMFRTRYWGAGGTAGVDDAFAERHDHGIGSEIMGANKFGPPGWPDDADWKGWWGPNPPFHTPTFVLTHRPRPSIEMAGGTTFHFLDAAPAEALDTAREAADGLDVRIGGGATIVRDFVAAGLVDHMHLVQVPIVLGRGVRVWDGLEALEDSYDIEPVSSPSGVTHLTFTRKVGS